ncbi:purine-cytosine permease family protein [Streptomyces sp. SS]|uniref:purine-cytosine permease family protein n=1 Tax=Streptomyces sp. SS TaxID=260742 RepID=UPI000474CDA6|nr:cytosine permease [Streptomyces sp. SS]
MTEPSAVPSQRDVRSLMEDHALTPVPASERRSGWGLMTNTAGIASTLVQLAIGGGVTLIAGVWYGILAGVVVAVFGGVLGWLVGHVAYKSGTSSTVTARFYGLGRRGSALASVIFAFMILGFLALENALLYHGTLFMLGWHPNLGNALLIYGVLTLVWIALTTFGLKVVQRTSTILLISFVVLTVGIAVMALTRSGASLSGVLSGGPVAPGYGGQGERFMVVLSILAGSAGALALNDADFARYARSSRDVGILAIGGAIMVDVFVVILGTIIIHAGFGAVGDYLTAHPHIAATQAGNSVAEKVTWMVNHNSGAFFVVLAGLTGFLLMYVAQAKAQVLNSYSGSLALSNLVDSLTGRNPGRVAMVVVGNVIGLLMVAGDILGLVISYLGVLGVVTTSLAGVIIADFFIVRRGRVADADRLETVNWAGVASVLVATTTGGVLQATGVTSLGFLVSLITVLVAYPALRSTVLRPGDSRALAR